MKILAITACTAGIAHTYIAKEKLENAAKELGDSIKVETQGSIGVENELTPEEVRDADVGVFARFSRDRFEEFVVNFFEEEGIDTSHIRPCVNGESLGLTFTGILSHD